MKKLYLLPSILFLFLFVLNSFSYGQKFTSFVKTYDTGEKWYEGNYKDGKVDGSYTFWYKNGEKFNPEKAKEELQKEGINIQEIIKLSESSDFTGTVLEVENHEKSEKVIISIENR